MKILLFCAMAFLVLYTASVASTVRNKEFGYSMTLPETWKAIPQTVVTEIIAGIASIDSTFARDKIEHAFQPKNLKEWFGSPHVLVEYKRLDNSRRLRLDQYETIYTPEIRKKGKGLAGSITEFTTADSIGFSQQANIIWIKAVTMLGREPVIRMLAGFIPTADGIMKIYCFSDYDKYRADEEVFKEIITSVSFAEEGTVRLPFFESMNLTKLLMMIIGVVFICFFVIALKKNLS